MKIMNTIYKPATVSVANDRRIFIFWTNTKDEVVVRARPKCGGVWSPNHFVPLLPANRSKTTSNIWDVILSPEV